MNISSRNASRFCLLLASFFVTTAFGFILLFAIVIMPGISDLDDAAFLRAFQVMDGTIQNNQPMFAIIWMGSILALAASLCFKLYRRAKDNAVSFTIVTGMFFVGQIITFAGNIPLNNTIHAMDISDMSEAALSLARTDFENTWNRWNNMRTVLFGVVSAYLHWALLQEEKNQDKAETEDSLVYNTHADLPRYT